MPRKPAAVFILLSDLSWLLPTEESERRRKDFCHPTFRAPAQPPMFLAQQLQVAFHILQTQQLFLQPFDVRFSCSQFLAVHWHSILIDAVGGQT